MSGHSISVCTDRTQSIPPVSPLPPRPGSAAYIRPLFLSLSSLPPSLPRALSPATEECTVSRYTLVYAFTYTHCSPTRQRSQPNGVGCSVAVELVDRGNNCYRPVTNARQPAFAKLRHRREPPSLSSSTDGRLPPRPSSRRRRRRRRRHRRHPVQDDDSATIIIFPD